MSLCKVYKGEETNPIDQNEDELKWYIWRTERAAVRDCEDHDFKSTDEVDELLKRWIRNACGDYSAAWAGGDPVPYFKRYFSF